MSRSRVVGAKDAIPSLTVRELQVIDLVSRGLTQKETARLLKIGESRVQQLLGRARKKTGTDSSAHLVGWAFRRGLLG